VEVVASAPPPPSGFDSDADLDSLFNLFSTPSEAGQPGEIDWAVVSELREEAAQRLSTWPGQQELTDAARRDVGRRIVEDLLGERAAEMLRAGGQAWDPETERAMASAVVDMLFGLGRIQPLVDDPTIEDIYITGSDPTWLTHFGRPACAGPPVADTDQELVDFLAFIASRADPPRAFSPSQPNLDLNLGGGVARLSAQAWVTARPYATIRLHRHRQVTLDDLVALGTITPVLATFLSASVRAKLSLVVAGAMGAGKTTLLRALCAELDPDEPIGTFETDYELLLHDLPEQHRLVRAWEERQGQGDINQAGGRAGTFGLDQALFASFRQSLSRQIVGEVRGREIIPMIKAMQSGTGSLSTTHSQSARGAIDKLVTCAMETGVTEDYALRALGTSVQIVVYVAAEEVSGRRQRVVTEVVAVGFTAEGIQYTDVFTRASGLTGPARAAYLPDHLRLLTRHGFDLPAFNMDSAQYRMEVGG
jgi:Flp pilus assembly CpaF family ATPase